MKSDYIFYQLLAGERYNIIKINDYYRISIFIPSITKLNLLPKFNALYLFWFILTLGQYQIYYVFDKNNIIIHSSIVMPKIYKYAFINKIDSIHIGPCWTHEQNRGFGIYPSVLAKICTDFPMKNIFIFTDIKNIASQKGIEKVGFKKFAEGIKTKHLGIYQIIH